MCKIIVKKADNVRMANAKTYEYNAEDPFTLLRACLSRDAKTYHHYNGELDECFPIQNPANLAKLCMEGRYPVTLCKCTTKGCTYKSYRCVDENKKPAKAAKPRKRTKTTLSKPVYF